MKRKQTGSIPRSLISVDDLKLAQALSTLSTPSPSLSSKFRDLNLHSYASEFYPVISSTSIIPLVSSGDAPIGQEIYAKLLTNTAPFEYTREKEFNICKELMEARRDKNKKLEPCLGPHRFLWRDLEVNCNAYCLDQWFPKWLARRARTDKVGWALGLNYINPREHKEPVYVKYMGGEFAGQGRGESARGVATPPILNKIYFKVDEKRFGKLPTGLVEVSFAEINPPERLGIWKVRPREIGEGSAMNPSYTYILEKVVIGKIPERTSWLKT